VEVNRGGKCEGPGGGDRRGALCTGFTLVYISFQFSGALKDTYVLSNYGCYNHNISNY